MGDPKKPKKTYDTPRHPWQKDVIDAEKILMRDYGLTNKKELWKMKSILKKFKMLTKKFSVSTTEQSKKESELVLEKLRSIGILDGKQNLDDVLGMDVKSILDRRLQTVVFKKNLANTIKQARQFIVHNHVTVDGKKVNVPGYVVKKHEEGSIDFSAHSNLAQEDHPEIAAISKKLAKGE